MNDFGHEFRSRILKFKTDYPVSIEILECVIGFVIGVHAHGMIQGVEVILDCLLHDLEVTNHLVLVQVFRLEHEFNFPSMPVWKLTLVWMLRKHVAVFNIDGFADSEGQRRRLIYSRGETIGGGSLFIT